MSPAVAVLHPGHMGAAVAALLRKKGTTVLWCPAGRSRETGRRAREADLVTVRTLDELVSRADLILSICPPAAAEDVAAAVADHGFRGLYVEANAISPVKFRRIADVLISRGARVMDAAIVGRPPTAHAGARIYLAGHATAGRKVSVLFADTAMQPVILGEVAGAASALKMAHLSYQKASSALAAVSLALADEHGVTDHLLAEAEREPRSALTDPTALPAVAARAGRSVIEMVEAADAMEDAGLPAHLARAACEVLGRWAQGTYRPGTPPEDVRAALRRKE